MNAVEMVRRLCLVRTKLDDFFNMLLIQLHKLTLFHLQKKERSLQSAVWSEPGRSGECRQVALRHEEVVKRFAGSCSVADSFNNDSGCIISLHGEERGG